MMSCPSFDSSSFGLLSSLADDCPADQSAFLDFSQIDDRNDDIIIEIADVLAKMYRKECTTPLSQPQPAPAQQEPQSFEDLFYDDPCPVQQSRQLQFHDPATQTLVIGQTQPSRHLQEFLPSPNGTTLSTQPAQYDDSHHSNAAKLFASGDPYNEPTFNSSHPYYSTIAQDVASFSSQFRPPRDLGRELLSGFDELRDWHRDETSDVPSPRFAQTTSEPDHSTLAYSDDWTPLQELLQAVTAPKDTRRKRKDFETPAPKRKSLICSVCNQEFRNPNTLRAHLRRHAGEKPFECHVCKKTFTAKSTLTAHFRIHTGAKPYECQFCQKSYRDYSTYTKHVRTHTGEKPCVCRVCGRGFSQPGNMKRHLLNVHGEKC